MFDSQKAYGGISNNNKNNNNYGDTSYYNNSTSSNDSFWGNRNQSQNNTNNNNNRVNYRDTATISDAAIANDSLYGYNSVDNNNRQNLEQQQIDSGNKNGKYGNLASIVATSSKQRQTTWASIASQPAKSQPKSLKAKMAAGLSGTTSKHLPPSVTMDAMSWDSKNGGSKSVPPPPPTVAAAVINNPSAIHPSPLSTPTLDDELYPSVDVSSSISSVSNPPLPPAQVTRDNSLCNNNGNSSPAGSITNSDTSRQTPVLQSSGSMPKQSNEYQAPYHQQQHHNGNHSQSSNQYSHSQRNDYHTTQKPSMMMDNHYNSQHQQQQQSYGGGPKNVVAHQGSYHSRPVAAPPAPMQPPPPAAVNHSEDEDEEKSDNDPNKFNELHVLLLEKLCIENNYNPEEFDLNLRNARFFIIKSYSEDDIHRSIKYSIWCSTEHGNKRLDNAFRQQEDKGPIYLFFSVNRSGHFCGVAQMMSHVDYNASSGVWSQDKWKGQFKVKWIYIKDVPNDELRHITLENNENKPVTNSRDTQEVPYEKGKAVIAIIHRYKHLTSIFDDFLHYEKKQEEELNKRPDQLSSPPHVHKYYSSNNKMNSPNSHYPHHGGGGAGAGVGGNMMPPAPLREPPNGPMYRGNNQNYINHKPRSYNDRDGFSGGGGGSQGGGGGAYRNDYHRNDQYQSQQMFPPSQHSRNNFRNNYGNDNRNRNVDYRGNRGGNDPYYRDGSGYNRSGGAGGNSGVGGNREYYGAIPPAQPGYATMDNIDNPEFATMDPIDNREEQRDYAKMDINDYRDERDYPPPRNHDRVQSWRN